MEHEELTGRIIKAALAVHKSLGPGFLESIYEAALCIEFDLDGLTYEKQKPIPLTYRGRGIGEHRIDILVEKTIIVELKAVTAFEDIHFAVVRSYLKACGLNHGLLMNFSSMPLTVKRVLRERNVCDKKEKIPAFLLS